MSTVDHVEAEIRRELLRGTAAPGTRLRQDDLARRLGVSKIPVREALQRLAGVGLLRFEPNRGAVVPSLQAEDASEIFALRRQIEPLLLQRALPQLTIVDLAEAELALDAGPEARSLPEANWAFHRALYRASGWDRGVGLAETLQVAVAPYVALYHDGLQGAEASHREHLELLDACRAGDAAAARRILLHHLGAAEQALLGHLAQEHCK
jgi:DNA-binding GntR family transcriptional regulator